MNTFQLTCFLTVADTLSFARSAEMLHVTQPAVTHQIRSLEKELNVSLFDRTTHSVELTRSGLLLLDDAKTIVATSQRVKKRCEIAQAPDFPVLRLAFHEDSCPPVLIQVLDMFRTQHPDIHIDLQQLPTQGHLRRYLEDEKTDLALLVREPDNALPASIVYRELVQSPLVCVCAASHPLAGRESLTAEEFAGAPMIAYAPLRASTYITRIHGRLIMGRSPENLQFCESTRTGLLLAQAGFGLFPMPRVLVPDNPALAVIPLEGAEIISYGVCSHTLHPLAKEFLRLLQETFPE
ncbi:MAG: LysR family transcriptional regulator [Lachnospiraceae bacterium]|nr:LysR family transcriptional regulator [Lachnospiraceae bacterium]